MNYQAWAGSLTPEGGTATAPPLPSADLAAGMTAAFGICAAVIGRATSGQGTSLDISMTDVMATWTGAARTGPAGADGFRRHARLRPLRHGRRRAGCAGGGRRAALLGRALAPRSASGTLVGLDFEERTRRGAALQRAVGAAVATRERDQLVAELVAAGVPVAPVLDRAEMLASAPFPTFPIRLPLLRRRPGRPGARRAPRAGLPRAALRTDVVRRSCYVACGPMTS